MSYGIWCCLLSACGWHHQEPLCNMPFLLLSYGRMYFNVCMHCHWDNTHQSTYMFTIILIFSADIIPRSTPFCSICQVWCRIFVLLLFGETQDGHISKINLFKKLLFCTWLNSFNCLSMNYCLKYIRVVFSFSHVYIRRSWKQT